MTFDELLAKARATTQTPTWGVTDPTTGSWSAYAPDESGFGYQGGPPAYIDETGFGGGSPATMKMMGPTAQDKLNEILYGAGPGQPLVMDALSQIASQDPNLGANYNWEPSAIEAARAHYNQFGQPYSRDLTPYAAPAAGILSAAEAQHPELASYIPQVSQGSDFYTRAQALQDAQNKAAKQSRISSYLRALTPFLGAAGAAYFAPAGAAAGAGMDSTAALESGLAAYTPPSAAGGAGDLLATASQAAPITDSPIVWDQAAPVDFSGADSTQALEQGLSSYDKLSPWYYPNATAATTGGGSNTVGATLGNFFKDPLGALSNLTLPQALVGGLGIASAIGNANAAKAARAQSAANQAAAAARQAQIDNPGAPRYTFNRQQLNPTINTRYGMGPMAQFFNYSVPQPITQAKGGLASMHKAMMQHAPSHAFSQGPGGGQADQIPAMLSDGEYVMDADVVSALGDGSNEKGAQKLDAMRENIRSHKRAAPVSKIPPKAKAPEQYLKRKA